LTEKTYHQFKPLYTTTKILYLSINKKQQQKPDIFSKLCMDYTR